jgi:long-chain acyl-CoA synthetase
VPIYTSLTSESARQLMEHCEPVACFIGPVENANLITLALPARWTCIRFPNAPDCEAKDWDAIAGQTQPIAGNPVRSAEDVATIIYTSGTTGSPKGVMHSFRSFPYFAKAVAQMTGETRHRGFSYLPLAHIAERALMETSAIYFGWHIFFCEGVATFVKDLQRSKSTVFFSVPRLYAKFQQNILAKAPQEKLDRLLRIPVASGLAKKRILEQLGLSTVEYAASGSAALQIDLLLWFRKLGLPLAEGYGATETGITHTPPGGRSKPGYVGCSTPGVETKIDENHEVLLRSPMNMVGYFKDAEGTCAVFTEDGFIRTGDLGEVDAEGWLKLNGRIKEQFKTTKGKYVSPSAIESLLSGHNAVESCLVMGSGLAAPCAVIVLSPEAIQRTRDAGGRHELEQVLDRLLRATNAKLEHHEQLKFLAMVDSKWSVENGFITPTLKLKRQALEHYYAPFIEKWLAQEKSIVWHLNSDLRG